MPSIGNIQPQLKKITERINKFMKEELDDLHKLYKSGYLLVSYGRYRKLSHGVMNKYAITRKYMIAQTEKYFRNF